MTVSLSSSCSVSDSTEPLQAAVLRQARLTPDRIAVRSGDTSLTYRDFAERVVQTSGQLCDAGVQPGDVVALCMSSPVDRLVGLMAVLTRGGVVLAMEMSWPEGRFDAILEDSRPRWMLQGADDPVVSTADASTLRLSHIGEGSCEEEERIERSLDEVSFLIYTSGSTGKPKGVQTSQRGIVEYLGQLQERYPLSEEDTVVSLVSPSYDSSLRELFAPLTRGAQLVLPLPTDFEDPVRLLNTIRESKVTALLSLIPSRLRAMALLADKETPVLSSLRLIMTCGEALLPQDVEHLRTLFGEEVTVVNQYGVSEVTQGATWFELPRTFSFGQGIPVGEPLPHVSLDLLDENGDPVSDGEPGEIVLGGSSLSSGYLHVEESVRERFFTGRDGGRFYRTGDLGVRRKDGLLYWSCRSDDQLSVRGMRVEPGELQAAMMSHPLITESFATKARLSSGNEVLVAYFVPAQGQMIPRDELLAYLRTLLPEEHLPTFSIPLDGFPTLPNGKVDRSRLPPLHQQRPALSVPYRAPQTDVERGIASCWQEALRIDLVGVDDDFYDLGGNSLLAVEVLVALEKRLEVKLPFEVVFLPHTIAELTELIAGKQRTRSYTCSEMIHAEGTLPPLFAVGGLFGEVFRILQVGKGLPENQPFVALHPPNLDWTLAGCVSVEEMASCYVEEVKRIQPRGPYDLMGTSFGGAVVFDMALQLQRRGDRVRTLVIVDTAPIKTTREMAEIDTYYQVNLDGSERKTEPAIQAHLDVSWQHLRAVTRYRNDHVFQGKLVYVRSTGNTEDGAVPGSEADPRMRWRKRASCGLELVFIPGQHGTFHHDPQCALLVKALHKRLVRNRWLERVPGRALWRQMRKLDRPETHATRYARFLDLVEEHYLTYRHFPPMTFRRKVQPVTPRTEPRSIVLGFHPEMILGSFVNAMEIDAGIIAVASIEDLLLEEGGPSVLRGIRFRNGRVIEPVAFDPPLPVGYVFNTEDVRWCWPFLEHGIPVSMHHTFEHLAHNKVATSAVLSRTEGLVPAWKSFLFAHEVPRTMREDAARDENMYLIQMDQVKWPEVPEQEVSRISAAVSALMKQEAFQEGVVVKPVMGGSGQGVTIFDEPVAEQVVEAILTLLRGGNSVIVQHRIQPAPVLIDGVAHDWNYRVFLTRDAEGHPEVVSVLVRVDRWGDIVNLSTGAVCWCFEELVSRLGLDPDAEWKSVSQVAIDGYLALADESGERITQDFASADIMRTREGDHLIIEMNGRTSAGFSEVWKRYRQRGEKVFPLAKLFEQIERRRQRYNSSVQAP